MLCNARIALNKSSLIKSKQGYFASVILLRDQLLMRLEKVFELYINCEITGRSV
jgi:hypothetical protein